MIHVNRGATSLGVFSEEEVREGLRTSRFAPTDIGWREGMATWQSLSQFPELAAAAPAAPPPQTGATSELTAPRSGLPWDERQTKGFFNAFVETLMMVLGKPGVAFTVMKREGGLGEPLLYLVVGSSFGIIVYFLMTLLLPSAIPLGDRHGLGHLVGAGIGSVFMIILAPVFAAIGAFIASAIFHVCLMIVGGARHSFETTFRVVCFTGGSIDPLLIIPFCGGLIVGIWKIVLYCIGLSRAHETDIGRAVLAVFLPLIVCCGGVLLIAFMFGALGAWSASQH
ncbi:MAG TPA: YIP1 family protein [Candidatus Binatus sp.]|nr:YIP1 family protein [Candidatus Binatus sp.]